MYCLIDFCCICFYNREHLQPLSGFGSDNITYFIKLTSCVPEMYSSQMNIKRLVCNKCCETMDAAYKFRQRCLRSKTMLTDYISQLHQVSNINGVANVYLIDLNKFDEVKKEHQKENNMEKTEMFINVNENTNEENFVTTTEIKWEDNPMCLKLIETGPNYIQLGNVIIKREQKNQNSDEGIEETLDNILINKDDTKIDVSQNDIKLTANPIKKENENQEEHLHERFDNILETFVSEIDDTTVKAEENNYNSLYSEKCFDDPSANLDEIKIDIVDNDIKSIKSEINIQYKSEDIAEFSTEDNGLSLEDQDKLDKEANFSHKILKVKQKKTSLRKKTEQKKCGIVNRKDKIVKKHECSICKKNFLHSSSLKRHMKIYTKDNPNECNLCQKKFSCSSKLTEHMRMHTGEKPYECDICQKKFTRSSNLKEHKRFHTGEKPHECDICQKKCSLLAYLKKHMRIHTGEKPYECDICQKKFGYSSGLKEHKRFHTGEKSHECDICLKKFTQLSKVKKHMRIHTGEKPYKCDVCQKKFSDSSSLKNHKRIHTGEKSHECNICQKKFIQSCNLKKHMRIHTGEKPYKCDICQKKFGNSSNLKEHKRFHTREKSHECDICQKKFIRSSDLRKHMRSHTGAKPYECDICQKKFGYSSNLRKHERFHTGEKSHKCNICQKKFTQSSDLRKHMRSHIGEKP